MMHNKALFCCPFETKSLSTEGCFEGYASTFQRDLQQDMIMPGAFRHTLSKWRNQQRWPLMLWHHHLDTPIGQWLTLCEDHKGLYVKGQLLLELFKAQEVYALLKKDLLKGLSIGFQPITSCFDRHLKVRKIFQLHLIEISIVSLPANQGATIANVKSQKRSDGLF